MQSSAFHSFVQIIQRLRKECPWDREQTHLTLLPYLIEEAYEVVDSIEKNNPSEMKEELGDLLLQITLHSIIAAESNKFTLEDVIEGISEKMIRRHPHVFGESKASSSEEVRGRWEKIKNKKQLLSGLPSHLPALLKAFRVGEKCAGIGFDWKDAEGAFQKVEEELQEVREVMDDPVRLEEEIGDLLFAISSFARLKKIEPEESLRKALQKFQKRFEKIEAQLKSCSSLEEMEELWQKSKSE